MKPARNCFSRAEEAFAPAERRISTGRIAAFADRRGPAGRPWKGAEARDSRLTVGPAVVDESKPDRSTAAQRFGDSFGAAPPAEG